jgi:hypothetical protein
MGYPNILLEAMPPAGAFAPISKEEILEKLFNITTDSESPSFLFLTARAERARAADGAPRERGVGGAVEREAKRVQNKEKFQAIKDYWNK